jgi:hypothetical protein
MSHTRRKLSDSIKIKLEKCVDCPSTLKEGFFIHTNGKINNHWVDLSGLHRQFLLNKSVVKKALRKKLIEEIKKNSINTIVFTTQYISGTSDFRLSCIDSIVYETLQEFNRKKKTIEYSYIRRITTIEGLTLIPILTKTEDEEFNVLLITAMSLHRELIEEALNGIGKKLQPKSRSVLSIIAMRTRKKGDDCDFKEDKIPKMFKTDSCEAPHTYLMEFCSDQRPDVSEDHKVTSNIEYNFSDYLTDQKYYFLYDVRGISAIVLSFSFIFVLVYYNLLNINGLIEFLEQNRANLIIGVAATIIGSAILYLIKKFSTVE